MGEDREPTGSGLIVYLDRSEIREGRTEDLKHGVRRLVAFIERREPRLIHYGFHIDEEAGLMTVLAVHPDSASLELHLEVGGPEFRRLADLITLRSIEVYGSPSDRALEMLEQKANALGDGGVTVQEQLAGFTRLTLLGGRA